MNFKSKNRRIYLLSIILISVVFVNCWILYFNFSQVNKQEELLSKASEIIGELDHTLLALVNMETSQRGFLIIKNKHFLQIYRDGEKELIANIDQLSKLVDQNTHQSSRLQKLIELINLRHSMLEDVLQDAEDGEAVLIKRHRLLVEGNTLMGKVRNLIDDMKSVQRNAVLKSSQRAKESEVVFLVSLFFTSFVSLCLIGFALRLFSRNSFILQKEAEEKEFNSQTQVQMAKGAKAVAGVLSWQEFKDHIQIFLSENLNVLNSQVVNLREQKANKNLTTRVEGAKDTGQTSSSLVEEAGRRDELWVLSDVPDGYWQIKSSLGSSKPSHLAFLPLTFQGEKIGLIEMGSFSAFNKMQEEVLHRCGEIFGVGLNAVLNREELQNLLERTQNLAEELEAQQEELKANNEELEQQTGALESQREVLNLKNSQLEEAQADLEEKAQELIASSKYKSEFLAKMSHELRTPLNGLMILSSLLKENKDKNLKPNQLEFADSIHKAGQDLLLLINDILDLSKIEARKLELKPSEFFLDSLVRDLKNTFENQAKAKGIEFNVQITKEAKSAKVFTDRLRLEQILRNFLSNAIKFTDVGSVGLVVEIAGQQDVVISVSDTGVGIPQEKLGLIFEAFEQADSSVDRRFGGTGLGLNIARELTTLLNGEIDLVSEVGKGSCFTLKFSKTLKVDSAKKITSTQQGHKKASFHKELNATIKDEKEDCSEQVQEFLKHIDSRKKTLMIVEDDEPFLRSITNLAKDYDFQPIAVNNGELALAILKEFAPDAVLLDIKLPGISGMSLLEKIKNSVKLRHIPVHMISAMNYQSTALRMGALGYLTKPVTLEKVRSALERIESMISNPVRNILIIEDDEVQSLAIRNLIEGKDVSTTLAKTGAQALQKIKQQPFDCIVLDLKLPDTSGFEFLDQLNSLEISLPPLVIYTGKELTKEEETHLYKYSESIIIKGARSPERLLDEVNLFLHRVESLMPVDKRQLLVQLRAQEENFKGKTVLLVDDDLRNLFALTNALESKSLKVITAKDGLEGLEALESQPDIDLVLMDIMMPRMNGFEAMKKIRQNKDFRIKNIPIVALTAKAMRGDHEKCIECGANDYMPKPINLDHLNTILKIWLPSSGSFV